VTARLREITHLRGDASPGRRWFASPDLDLIVWTQPDGRMGGFQLCYDKQREEKALTWREGRGFVHNRVDTGEDTDGGHKGTPVLDGALPWDARRLLDLFSAASAPLPMTLRLFVERKLRALQTA